MRIRPVGTCRKCGHFVHPREECPREDCECGKKSKKQ